MHDHARASAWRAVSLVLGAAWVVMACGGSDERVMLEATGVGAAATADKTALSATTTPASTPGPGAAPAAAAAPCADGPGDAAQRATLPPAAPATLHASPHPSPHPSPQQSVQHSTYQAGAAERELDRALQAMAEGAGGDAARSAVMDDPFAPQPHGAP